MKIHKLLILLVLCTSFALADQSSSYGTTDGFYSWYIKSGMDYREKFSEAKPYFTEELYALLSKGFDRNPDSGWFVDFDPFINAQMDAEKVSVGKPKTIGNNLDMVRVTPTLSRGEYEIPPVKVYCVKSTGSWKIANIVYPESGFDLKGYLSDGLGR